MITIQNRQRTIPLNIEHIRKDIQICLETLGYDDFDIGVLFTSAATIQQYNKKYRHHDKPTDILSFSYYPDLKAGQRIKPLTPEDRNLGDLIICPAYIKKHLAEYDTSFEERLRMLLVHGICHLLGYDHISDKDYEKMQTLEDTLLTALVDKKHIKSIK